TLDSQTVPQLARRWEAPLDGLVAASPLYAEPLVDGVQTGVVYVETEAGSVYALAAADGRVLWREPGAGALLDACGSFLYGISSTGAIDRSRDLLYTVGADGLPHAYDLATGAEAEGYPVPVVASPADQYVWGGLRIVGSTLYVPVSPFCDRMIKLNRSLAVVDSDYPPGIDPAGDQDFGSAPVLFQPHGCPPLAAANSKNGVLYLWNRISLAAGPIAGLGVGDAHAPFV